MLRGVCLRFSGIGPANSVVTCHPAIIYFYLYKQLLLEKVTGEAFRNMTWAASLGKCLQPAQTKLSPNAAVFVEAICPWSLLYCLWYTATLSHSFLSLFLFFPWAQQDLGNLNQHVEAFLFAESLPTQQLQPCNFCWLQLEHNPHSAYNQIPLFITVCKDKQPASETCVKVEGCCLVFLILLLGKLVLILCIPILLARKEYMPLIKEDNYISGEISSVFWLSVAFLYFWNQIQKGT